MTRLVLSLGILLSALCLGVGPAPAAEASSLDPIASAVAGHPIQVQCADTWAEWTQWTGGIASVSDNVEGFTRIGVAPIIYLNPRICMTLLAAQNTDAEQVGAYYLSEAISVIAHESTHQRGIYDEGVVDCTAVSLVPSVAERWFDVPATVSTTSYKVVTKYVLVNKKRVRTQAVKQTTITTPNPFLVSLETWAERWHKSRPAQYQGGC